jgi:hypothetical protein
LIVFDHSHPQWQNRYNRHSRVNGAFTYSRDICKWHLPIWHGLLGPEDVIATCGKVKNATVQYLHERTHVDLSDQTKLFVTTYRDLADALGERGLWLPNMIDTTILPIHEPVKDWVYYGNIMGQKESGLERLAGMRFDRVSRVRDQQEALRRVAQYRYGIGVGRCALEMMAMGMKVLIFGKDFGGLTLSENDFDRQRSVNFNANLITGVADIAEGVARIDDSLCLSSTFQQSLSEIEQRITRAWQQVM